MLYNVFWLRGRDRVVQRTGLSDEKAVTKVRKVINIVIAWHVCLAIVTCSSNGFKLIWLYFFA